MTSWRTGPLTESELVDGIRMLDIEATRCKLNNLTKQHDLCQRIADLLAACRDLPSARYEISRHWTMQYDHRDDCRDA